MPQSFACLHYHIVFSTKERRPTIDPEIQPRLYDYIGGIVRRHDGSLLAAGGTDDHIHLLAGIHRTQAVADAVREIKSNSSKWVHETFPDRGSFGWQDGYGAFSISWSNIDAVKAYIAGQEEHHRERSFQDEFVALLRRHDIAFDEQYIWS